MDTIPADVLRKIALDISPRDLLHFCLTNKRIKNNICDSDIFWRNKILEDYPIQMKYGKHHQKLFKENPKKLYNILGMKARLFDFCLIFGIILKLKDISIIEKINEVLTSGIGKQFIEECNFKRGDMLDLGNISIYRGKYIWDGEKIVNLNKLISFTFPEFRPDYFSNIFNIHNVMLSPEKIQEAIQNFNVETQKSYITDKYNKYPLELNVEISDLVIKFNDIKIFFSSNPNLVDWYTINFIKEKEIFVLNIPVIPGLVDNNEIKDSINSKKVTYIIEWKEAIKEIIPNPDVTFRWEGDELILYFYKTDY